MSANDLSPAVRDALSRLVALNDRSSPVVFTGRDGEFALLERAVRSVQLGGSGSTVVVKGVPGAGKTALMTEYASRLLAVDADAERPVIPVLLRPSDFDTPPATLLRSVDESFKAFQASSAWATVLNRVGDAASLLGHAVFAACTRRSFNEFKPSAQAPDSLPVALEEYVAFRFGGHASTFHFLVDEAQNLNDTPRARAYLDVLHGGVYGRSQATLACFGLANTDERLGELGLSRFAKGHIRSIGMLSNEDAKRTVTETLETALAGHTFNEQRENWIGAIADVILAESANFPHHLANGCHAFAQMALDEGVADATPTEELRERCREYKREYYEARLKHWEEHTIALAHVFGGQAEGWKAMGDIAAVLMASDDYGDPVSNDVAKDVVKDMHYRGYLDRRMGAFRPALPSLTSHFASIVRDMPKHNPAVQAVRAVVYG